MIEDEVDDDFLGKIWKGWKKVGIQGVSLLVPFV